MPVIIDGYNLLRSIPNDESSNPVDDVQLCRILGEYLTAVSETGQIIFDGIGPPDKTGFDNIRNLEVFFSGQSLEADDVIEDKLKLNTAPKRLMVVSSDRRLRKAAMARKAIAVKSDVFWQKVQKQLARKAKFKEPSEKRQGLNQGETNQWMKFFGIEQ